MVFYRLEHAIRISFDNKNTINLTAQTKRNTDLIKQVFGDNHNINDHIQFDVSLHIDNAREIDSVINNAMAYTLLFDCTSVHLGASNCIEFTGAFVKQIEEHCMIGGGYESDEPEPYMDEQVELSHSTRIRVQNRLCECQKAIDQLETLKEISNPKVLDLGKINYVNCELDRICF